MTVHSFLEKLSAGKVILGDGAMGTELQKRGLSQGCLEEYNVSHPDAVQGIYLAYFLAGSDIVQTNSFGANRLRLKTHGCQERVTELNLRAAELAREVCPRGRFVGGSIGPTGGIFEPLGGLKEDTAFDAFAEQAEALAEGGVDVIYIETMSALLEAEIAIRAVKKRTGLPVIATMTFKIKNEKVGPRTAWGENVAQVVQRLSESGADVVGANCGSGFDEIIVIAREMRSLTDKLIIAQPDAGIPELVKGALVYNQTPELVRPKAEYLLKLGVNILGGCCGTGPAHIRMMRRLIGAQNLS